MKRPLGISLFVVLLLAGSAIAREQLRLSPLFTDGAVLQQGAPVPVWGWAEPGDRVTVTFAGQTHRTRVDEDGRWQVTLRPLAASRRGRPLTARVAARIHVHAADVLVGEVWLCSGQSNMAWPLKSAKDGADEVAAANHPRIRLLTVPRRPVESPQASFAGRWSVCDPKTAGSFSAVGYFFGRELHRALKTPIGLINSSYGGTPAEAWTSRESLESEPTLAPLLERWSRNLAAYDPDKAKAAYEKQLASWKSAAKKAKADGKPAPRRPRAPSDPRRSAHRPASLYNGMIAPLVPYAIRGAIWYQGESNAGRAHQYRTLFPRMILDWRRAWASEDLPFHFVQLANFQPVVDAPGESKWAELRDAQLHALRTLPGTGMAVITDIGEARDIHPRNKQDVGRRLALWALARDYGKTLECSGPLCRDHERRGAEIVLRFDHVGKGLVADGELRGFAIAGADRKFVWGEARIEGETVVVSHPDVAEPVAVRYAWADNPPCTLRNEAGLPASPFRTDDWPLTTEGVD